MRLFRDRGDRPRLLGRGHDDGMTAAMTGATGAMTARTTAVTGGMTARTAVPDPDCCGDSSTPGRAQGE